MWLESAAFAGDTTIPIRYTGDGDDISPPLAWGEIPQATKALALVVDDPDAPRGTFTHWLAWNIHPTQDELSEDAAHAPDGRGLREGRNGFGTIGWRGPRPPPGRPHHYVFHLFALDEPLSLRPGASQGELERAMRGHLIDDVTLVGMYGD
jgi:Raf kinase inhibitor-like YbhB/YbcL family protein